MEPTALTPRKPPACSPTSRWAGPARPRRSPTPSCSSQRRNLATSTVLSSRLMAGGQPATCAIGDGDGMRRGLTITLDEAVHDGLYRGIGRRRISQFIESVVRPLVIAPDLMQGYQQMAADERREAEALEWAEATVADVNAKREET